MTVGHNPPVPASPRCCIWLSGHWVSGSRYLALRTWVSGPRKTDTGFHSHDLGFRTSINGLWVSLSGPGFQDVESSTSYGRLIFFPSLFSASIVTFLPRPVFPSLFSASSGHRRTDAPKRKAKNQRKERLRPLLFPEENPFVCPSVRPSGPVPP